MDNVSQDEYNKARETIKRSEKENRDKRTLAIQKIIEEHENTFWSKDEDLKKNCYFQVTSGKGFFNIISFEEHTNGIIRIEKHYLQAYDIETFIGKNLTNRVDVFDDDEDSQTCHCPQFNYPHDFKQHTPLKQLDRQEFLEKVQQNILNKMGGGLIIG